MTRFFLLFSFLFFRTKQLGENAPEIADLYFSYGKALLENAIVQSSVLGKEQPEEPVEEAAQGVLSNDLNGWLSGTRF